MEEIKENTIIIGRKPFVKYILALNSILAKGFTEIEIAARGRQTSKAIDLALFGKRVHNMNIENTEMMSETLKDEKGEKTFSTIKIKIKK